MEEKMKEKANYCLNCKIKPCSNKGCPLGNDIPSFIQAFKNGNIEKAYEILARTTVLSPICGRICPHQKQCEGSCVRGIKSEPVSIGEIEAFIGDTALKNEYKFPEKESNKNKKVAVVGGGPAGLTCSAFLARKGYKVTIYEKYNKLGGLLVHGIPDFRLPKDIVEQVVKQILDVGIDVEYEKELGKNLSIEQLKENYDAIFLAFGANISSKLGIEGENLQGVYGGNELLEYQNHPDYTNKKVAIIGGGNVAMDCARTIKRLGAKDVSVIYRRAEEQMPAEKLEVKEAKQEDVKFLFQYNIVKIKGEKSVEKVELIKTKLVKKEGESREVPINIEGSNETIPMDIVVTALGSKPEEFVNTLGLKLNKWGNIEINDKKQTSIENIFAGGDLAGEKGTVAWAAKSGRDAAEAIGEYLK